MRTSRPASLALVCLVVGCGDEPSPARDASVDAAVDSPSFESGDSVSADARPADDGASDAGGDDAAPSDVSLDGTSDSPAPDAATGPRVDRATPQLYSFSFRANEADPAATVALGSETAFLDTRVAPRGRLVVHLHGAGAPTTCGSNEHERLLASWGFHVLGPCYVSDYGVSNCGSDIAGCRLEAFDGIDHHPFVNIAPPDSIETRVVRALQLLQRRNPGGDWQYYLDGTRPRWNAIIISGISHGASSAGLIGQVRAVDRAVMLSGPLDTGQAWLARSGLTARTLYWGLTHSADPQHPGHLAAFESLGLPGAPTFIDRASAPYGGTRRLETSATTTDGHSSTQAGSPSPRDVTGRYLFERAWRRRASRRCEPPARNAVRGDTGRGALARPMDGGAARSDAPGAGALCGVGHARTPRSNGAAGGHAGPRARRHAAA